MREGVIGDGDEGGWKQQNEDWKSMILKRREIVWFALIMVSPHRGKGNSTEVIALSLW